jgi:hypothetical protein
LVSIGPAPAIAIGLLPHLEKPVDHVLGIGIVRQPLPGARISGSGTLGFRHSSAMTAITLITDIIVLMTGTVLTSTWLWERGPRGHHR